MPSDRSWAFADFVQTHHSQHFLLLILFQDHFNFTMSPKSRAGLALFAILSWSLPSAIAQGNTTCKGTTLDWYTSVVQETPCMLGHHSPVDLAAESLIIRYHIPTSATNMQ